MLDKIDKKYPNLREKILNPFIVNINPNVVTILALIAAFIAGCLFYLNFILWAAIFVLLNGFLDILDGEIAKKYRKTKFGDFLDHTCDRLSDVFILLGITFSIYIPQVLGFFLIIITILVSYLGTQAQALTKKRLYGGFTGRSDRIIIIFIASILQIFYFEAIYYGILILFVLSLMTFVQRFYLIYNELR